MAKIIFIIISGLFINTAFAKCPAETYTIVGKVLSNDKSALANVLVQIFFDDYEYGYYDLSSNEGEFKIDYFYKSYKRPSLFGDRCGKKPSTISIVFYKENFFSKKIKLQIKNIETGDSKNTFLLPATILVKAR